MKQNPELAKQLLERALKEMPGNSLVRFHVNRALNEIAKTKQPEKKPVTPWQQWKLDLQTGTLVPPNAASAAVTGIETLIAKEQARIAAIKQPKINQTPLPPDIPSSLLTD